MSINAMNAENAVWLLRKVKHPALGRNIEIDSVFAAAIADFIEQQERDAELGRAIFEVFHTCDGRFGSDCPVDACNGDTECKHCPFKKVCDLVTEREKKECRP